MSFFFAFLRQKGCFVNESMVTSKNGFVFPRIFHFWKKVQVMANHLTDRVNLQGDKDDLFRLALTLIPPLL